MEQIKNFFLLSQGGNKATVAGGLGCLVTFGLGLLGIPVTPEQAAFLVTILTGIVGLGKDPASEK